jgi:hypothetical protein
MKKVFLMIFSILVGGFLVGGEVGAYQDNLAFDWDAWREEAAERAAEREREAAERAAEREREAAERAAQRAAEKAEREREAAERAAEREREAAERAAQRAAEKAEREREAAKSWEQKQAEKEGEMVMNNLQRAAMAAQEPNSGIKFNHWTYDNTKCDGTVFMAPCEGSSITSPLFAGYPYQPMCSGSFCECAPGSASGCYDAFGSPQSWYCSVTSHVCLYCRDSTSTRLLQATGTLKYTICGPGRNNVSSNPPTYNPPPQPECGSADGDHYFSNLTKQSEGLCEPGKGTPTKPSSNDIDHTWKWQCTAPTRSPVTCQARKPYCNINGIAPVCINETASLSASIFPDNATLKWTASGGEPSEGTENPFKVAFNESASYPVQLEIKKDEATAKDETHVHVQPASCTVLLNPESSSADSVTVGDTINIKINTVCLGNNPQYSLDLDTESWVYAEGDDISDGEAKIEVKKSGAITFNATVEGEGTSVSCSSQISAFTEGSEWWERKPE